MNTLSLTLTRTQVAEMIGVSTKTVDRLCARGALPAARIGGRVVIRRQGVVEYLDGLFKVAGGNGRAETRLDRESLAPSLDELRAAKARAEFPSRLRRAA